MAPECQALGTDLDTGSMLLRAEPPSVSLSVASPWLLSLAVTGSGLHPGTRPTPTGQGLVFQTLAAAWGEGVGPEACGIIHPAERNCPAEGHASGLDSPF